MQLTLEANEERKLGNLINFNSMFRKPKKGKSSLFRQSKKKKRSVDEVEGDNDDNGGNSAVNNNNDDDDDVHPNGSATMKKGRKKFRKRSSSSSDEDGGGNLTGNGNDDDGDENTSALLQQIRNETSKKKGRAKNNSDSNPSSSLMHEFKSSKKSITQQELATSLAQHHPSTNKDAAATNSAEASTGIVGGPDEQTKKALEKPERNKFLAGPIRASKFIRTTSRFDYEPEICKDYKDTGFCGFGDSCIYLHDRTNMKSGRALEEEWEAKKRMEQEKKEAEINMFCTIIENNTSGTGADKSAGAIPSEEDGLPFACHVCRGPFEEPVVTQCSHYFCQSCILKRVRDENDPTCPICNQDTNGVFNYPAKLVNKKKRLVGRNGTWEEFANAMKQ